MQRVDATPFIFSWKVLRSQAKDSNFGTKKTTNNEVRQFFCLLLLIKDEGGPRYACFSLLVTSYFEFSYHYSLPVNL